VGPQCRGARDGKIDVLFIGGGGGGGCGGGGGGGGGGGEWGRLGYSRFEQSFQANRENLKITGEAETHKADFDNMDSLSFDAGKPNEPGSSSGTHQQGQPETVKKEPITTEEKKQQKQDEEDKKQAEIAKKVQEFMTTPLVCYEKMNHFLIESKTMQAQAYSHDYGKDFAEKLKSHATALTRVISVIDRVIQGDSVCEAKVPKTIAHMEKLQEEHNKHLQFGAALGFELGKPLAKKRRKGKLPKDSGKSE